MPINPFILLRRRNTWTQPQIMECWDKGGHHHDVRAYGASSGNATDSGAAVQAAITAAMASGGCPQVYIPFHTRMDSDPVFANDGAKQRPLRIFGPSWSWGSGNHVYGGGVLELRNNPNNALVGQIDLRWPGSVEIDHLTIMSGANTTSPIIKTRATCLYPHYLALIGNQSLVGANCVQDGIIYGGANDATGQQDDSGFQGYPSHADMVIGDNLRRVVHLGTHANGVTTLRSTAWVNCGGNASFPAFSMLGNTSGTGVIGGTFAFCLAEMNHRVYGFGANGSSHAAFVCNHLFDGEVGTLADIHLGSLANNSMVIAGSTITANATVDLSANTALILNSKTNTYTKIPTPANFPTTVAIGNIAHAGRLSVRSTDSTQHGVVVRTVTDGQNGALIREEYASGNALISSGFFGGQNAPVISQSGSFCRFTFIDPATGSTVATILGTSTGSIAAGITERFDVRPAADASGNPIMGIRNDGVGYFGPAAAASIGTVANWYFVATYGSVPVIREQMASGHSAQAHDIVTNAGLSIQTTKANGFVGFGNGVSDPAVLVSIGANGTASGNRLLHVEGSGNVTSNLGVGGNVSANRGNFTSNVGIAAGNLTVNGRGNFTNDLQTDANLYISGGFGVSGANQSEFNGLVVCQNNFHLVGQFWYDSATGGVTTPGTVQGKMTVYDNGGTPVGVAALYDDVT